MKHIFAVTSQSQLNKYQRFHSDYAYRLDTFLTMLQEDYRVISLPRAIIWTDYDTATKCVSDIPIPAYTNEYRTIFCPELEVWRKIYLQQLDYCDNPEIRNYYSTIISHNHVMQILGHEFVHHSDYFPDSDYHDGIWFEEGMCEYISRKFFLTPDEFRMETEINRQLVSMYQEHHANDSLDSFGTASYSGNFASIFFEYWRSFLTVLRIIEQHDNNPITVLEQYQQWLHSPNDCTLTQFFKVE